MSEYRGVITFNDNHIGYRTYEEGDSLNWRKLQHSDIYWKIINHLSAIGYSTGYHKIYDTNYQCLREDNHEANIKSTRLLFNRYPAGFEIKIENIKNYMGSCNSFWSSWHENYKKLTYLEEKQIQLAIKHIENFVRSNFNDLEYGETEPNNPIEKIFYSEKINSHIHNGAKNFKELKDFVDKNVSDYNSKDMEGNKLVCGQIKYFYSYAHGNRLCKCEVWHHINNMWWGITGGKKYNRCSRDYMDFSHGLPRKNPELAIKKINKLISKYESKRNYEKCIILRDHLIEAKLDFRKLPNEKSSNI